MKGKIIPLLTIFAALLNLFAVQVGAVAESTVVGSSGAAGSGVTVGSALLCTVIGDIKATIAFIAVALFMIGGVLYAVAQVMAGGAKQTAQGWAQGLIIGGIVGLILVALAQPLVEQIGQAVGISGTIQC